jgi:uncharacterized protein (DUF1501 family)
MDPQAKRPSRREVLSLGGGGFAALALEQGMLGRLLAEPSRSRAKARACIVLWLEGGPSQTDTFDPKPGRSGGGDFGALRTRVPGMEISDRLPRLAALADSFSLIRSMTSTQVDHGAASYLLRTGYDSGEGRPHPSLGALVSHELAPAAPLGTYVRILAGAPAPASRDAGTGPGVFGAAYQPYEIEDALQPRQGLPLLGPESDRRSSLAEELDREWSRRHATNSTLRRSAQRSTAARLEESGFLEALSLEAEPEELRASYGTGPGIPGGAFGAGCLLARRLVERGTRFVEVTLGGWDTHLDAFKALPPLLEALDRSGSALFRDLRERGLLASTLVVGMGEFGRTPWINADRGRDHYGRAFSVLLGGGGIPGGRIVGKTDPDGVEILEDPVTVPDLFATLLAAVGADPARREEDAQGGIVRLTNHGKAVKQLVE